MSFIPCPCFHATMRNNTHTTFQADPLKLPSNSENKPRGLSTEGNFRFKTNWASLIVGSKFTVFVLFYFVFEGNFPSTSPQGAYIWRGDLTEGFLRYRFGRLIFGEAHT